MVNVIKYFNRLHIAWSAIFVQSHKSLNPQNAKRRLLSFLGLSLKTMREVLTLEMQFKFLSL